MFPTKVGIIEKIGDSGVLLPDLIMRGLAASDRLKYYLTLIQSAYSHAHVPSRPAPNLRVQREASGVDDPALDRLIESSVGRGSDTVYMPGACLIVGSMFDEARRMMQPLLLAGKARSELRGRADIYQRRIEDLLAHAPVCADDLVTKSTIGTLTRLTENGHDTLYQLVIDLQWELNRLQSSVTMETIDGARVYGIQDDERTLVRAFMKGINETASLRFDRAGLVTTVAHEGDRLTIQNDLAAAPSHLIILHVAELSVTVTYADVHKSRIRFLQEMLKPFELQWTAPPASDGEELMVGQFTAASSEEVERFLTAVGSRLVFLIDWNRARKRLAQLVSKAEAFELLKWAADNNIGHAAFLKCGEVQLIEGALERAFSLELRPGARLDKWLGEDAARTFLMSVLRTTSSGLSAGRSLGLIEDEIEADLLRYLRTNDRRALADAADHAMLIAALDDQVQHTLLRLKNGGGHDEAARTSELAASYSIKADQIVRHAGRWLQMGDSDQHLRAVLTDAEAAVNALEETAFLLTLVPASLDAKLLSLVGNMAHLVGSAVREYVDCLEESQNLSTTSVRSDVESFLLTIDHLIEMGHRAHAEKRALIEKLLRTTGEFPQLFIVVNLAEQLEHAATALARCGPTIRDHVMRTRLSR